MGDNRAGCAGGQVRRDGVKESASAISLLSVYQPFCPQSFRFMEFREETLGCEYCLPGAEVQKFSWLLMC